MPNNPAPVIAPHFPASPHLSPTLSGYAAPDFATLALHPRWEEAYAWAVRNQVPEELIAIINLTQLHDSSVAMGTVTSFFADDNSISLLTEWQETEPAAAPLLRFSLAAFRDPEILHDYQPMAAVKAASSGFRGEIPQKYLTAMLAERPESTSPEEAEWLNTMKLWLMVHALNRSKLGNVQDILIRNASTRLRLSCKSEGNWRNIFLQLQPQSRDFDGISAGIRRRAQALLEKKQENPLNGTERSLLHAILDIDAGKEARDPQSPQNAKPIPFAWPRSDTTPRHFPAEELETYDDETESKPSKWVQSPATEGGGFTETEADPTQSYTHQAIQGNGLLLQCIEDLQHLPYSWSRLNPQESAALEKWIAQGWESDQAAIQYLTLITWAALQLGRSLKRTLSLEIGATLSADWRLDPEQFTFSRTPPRRTPGWSPGSPMESAWVSESAAEQSIAIPPQARDFIEDLLRAMSHAPATLGDFWDSKWGETPEKGFRKEIDLILPRVTGGMLGSHLAQTTFMKSGDPALARLIGSHPNTSLPGACAYASWTSRELAPYLRLPESDARLDDNAMGSRLDPIESLLVEAIKEATARIQQLQAEDDVASYHNAYVAYLAVALLAATAARPNRDPFEKIAHFDFEEAFVYISDKVSGSLRQGRLAPLPTEPCDMLREDYATHLRTLGKKFPHLEQPIQELLSGNPSAPLPYFFFLSGQGEDWRSVSETEIAKLGYFDWPLPLNHFRHRLATQLRRRGVDPEVIDALMGHAEAGTATHGDYSLRVWKRDIDAIRPAINSIYSSLGFVRIKPLHAVSSAPTTATMPTITRRPFGAELREMERRASLKEVLEDAKSQIAEFLDNRQISELSEQEVDALSRKLLFKSDGIPHPRGQLKYRILLKHIEREWRTNGKRVKISKRYQAIPEDVSLFTPLAPGALAKFQRLKQVSACIPSTGCNKRSFIDAAVLSGFLLCVENQITKPELLNDVIHAKNFRLVSANAKLYLEHSEALPGGLVDCPVQRYRISSRTARYLGRILSSKKAVAGDAIPEDISECVSILGLKSGITSSELLEELAKTIDQVNVMTLPGIAAGYLAGRVESYSLPWRDWSRQELGYPISIPDSAYSESDTESPTSVLPVSTAAYFPHPEDAKNDAMLEAARQLLVRVSEIISKSVTSDRGYSVENRKKCARIIQDLIESNATSVSSTIHLFCRWVSSLLFRKSRGQYIQAASISRYISALHHGFTECGYKLDILISESEEVTELYTQILEVRHVDNLKYVGERLADFHKWARNEFHIEDPDWSELPEMATTLHASPSFISEDEYLDALQLLDSAVQKVKTAQFAQELLMFCYRFGMRGNEAAALLGSDLQIDRDSIVALVQSNKHRKLKTSSSRRQVPLLFRLTDKEKKIFKRLLTRHKARHGGNKSMPIFGMDEIDERQISQAKRMAIQALKVATGNPTCNLHHARHSFANIIWNALTVNGLSGQYAHPSLVENVEIILLGRAGETRRKIWALSRLLGHGRRETTARSYLHFIGEFCDRHVGINETCNPDKLEHVISIDKFKRLARVDTSLLETIKKETAKPTYENVLQLMRLASRGQSISEAASALNLSQDVGEQLLKLLKLLGTKVSLSRSKLSATDASTSPHLRLLRRIKESTWNRLIKHAESLLENSNAQPVTKICIANIADMVGATRQILLWEEPQFRLLSGFIEFMGIKPEDYRLTRTNKSNSQLDKLLADFEFDYCIERNQPDEHYIQIDKATFGDGKYIVTERCAFTINMERQITVRRSTDLVVTFCAYAIACPIGRPLCSGT